MKAGSPEFAGTTGPAAGGEGTGVIGNGRCETAGDTSWSGAVSEDRVRNAGIGVLCVSGIIAFVGGGAASQTCTILRCVTPSGVFTMIDWSGGMSTTSP